MVYRFSCLPLPFRSQPNEKLTSVVSIAQLLLIRYWLNTHESRNGLRGSSVKNFEPLQTLECNRNNVFDVILVLILFDLFDSGTITWGIEHCTTQSIGTKRTFPQVKRQSFSLCWDILRHDVTLVDTTCTDQDEDEERDVVHHELRQLQSDASWIGGRDSKREICGFGINARCTRLGGFHLSG